MSNIDDDDRLPKAMCELCQEWVPLREVLQHLHRFHPEHYEGMDTWPDGEPVIIDMTLKPEDFGVPE